MTGTQILAEMLIKSMIFSLALTLAVEMGLAALLGFRSKWELTLVAAANVITNPLVVFTLSLMAYFCGPGSPPQTAAEILLELAAVMVEALLYWKFMGAAGARRPGPLILSILLNAASFAAGLLVSNVL